MQTILITGAYGFVGTNLSAYLKDRVHLWALDVEKKTDIYSRYFSWNDITTIPWDEIDAIIHLAGKAHDTKNKSLAQIYFDVNTGLTKKVFDCFLLSSAKKFIFFSSIKAAADSVLGDILTEDIIPKPKGPYGESKIAAENYILSRPSAGKQVYILRPCMIHGPGNKGNLNLLYNIVKKGIPWPLGAYENRRSFTSIDNLCFVIDRIVSNDIPSGIYNMGDDDALSTNELIHLMCEVMKRPCRIGKLNKNLMCSLAKVGTILHFPLNSERLIKLTENYVVSNTKIKQALGITKMPVSTKEGFAKTIQSFSKCKK
jgi:nucleoside-diphosphate-sugar epimerase